MDIRKMLIVELMKRHLEPNQILMILNFLKNEENYQKMRDLLVRDKRIQKINKIMEKAKLILEEN